MTADAGVHRDARFVGERGLSVVIGGGIQTRGRERGARFGGRGVAGRARGRRGRVEDREAGSVGDGELEGFAGSGSEERGVKKGEDDPRAGGAPGRHF